MNDLFASRSAAPVPGGTLTFAYDRQRPEQPETVVLAMHGIAGNLMAWRSVAAAIPPESAVSILAPDLRGRGDSITLPGPHGVAAHVADMFALLDHVGVKRAVLVGHSMGAYVAASAAADRPDRVAALILVDGGVPLADVADEDAAAARAMVIGPIVARHALTFSSADAYLDFWRLHPAFAHAWNDDVEAYLLHDLGGRPGALKYVVNMDAVEADFDDMLFDPIIRTAIDRVHAPVHLLRAPRGQFDDDEPLIPQRSLDAFVAEHPMATVENVAGVNHYSVLLGDSPGPRYVAAAIEAATRSPIDAR